MGIVAQAYPDIDEENDNEAQGLKCFGFLGIDNKELNRLFKALYLSNPGKYSNNLQLVTLLCLLEWPDAMSGSAEIRNGEYCILGGNQIDWWIKSWGYRENLLDMTRITEYSPGGQEELFPGISENVPR